MSAHILYFAQHGLAVDKADNPERPLSETGIERSKIIATQLLDSATSISTIFHSGKLRALQTAEIFASVLNIQDISAIKHLSPNDNVQLLAQNLTIENALYVGHLPHLDKMVSYLVSGDENAGIIQFQNSAIACLQKTNTLYQLQWYLSPEKNNRT